MVCSQKCDDRTFPLGQIYHFAWCRSQSAQQVQGKLAKENNTKALFSKHKHILLYIVVYILQVLSVPEYICLSVLVQMQTLIWKSAVFPYVSHQVFVLSQLFGL